jgi:hypothetical protein
VIKRKVTGLSCMWAAVALLALALEGTASAYICPPVPEIDPQTMGAGLAVLAGTAAMLLEGYRRRKG